MDKNKILVICEKIYDNIETSPEKGEGHGNYVRVKSNWYFINGEQSENISKIVRRLDDKHQFRLILIHAGQGDPNLFNLRQTLYNIPSKIHGFHTIGDEASKYIENCNTDWIIKHYEKNLISELLSLFLPLDIDMQALGILVKEKEKGKDPQEYLKEMYADNVNYLQKLKDLQYITNGVDNGASEEAKRLLQGQQPLDQMKKIDKVKLHDLSGIKNPNVCQFFEMLGNKEKDSAKVLCHNWGNGITSFHHWYRALAECLKDKEI